MLISWIIDFKKYIFKSIALPIVLLVLFSVLSYLGIIHNKYSYLLFIILLIIPFFYFFWKIIFKKEYFINKIDEFIEEIIEAKLELNNFSEMIKYLNNISNPEYSNLSKLTENDEKIFIENIKKFKIFIVKNSLIELYIRWINKDSKKLVNYINEKYVDYINEDDDKIFNKLILDISSGTKYTESIVELYYYFFWWNKDISTVSFFASYYPKNIINRLQEKNMNVFFKWIWNEKIS